MYLCCSQSLWTTVLLSNNSCNVSQTTCIGTLLCWLKHVVKILKVEVLQQWGLMHGEQTVWALMRNSAKFLYAVSIYWLSLVFSFWLSSGCLKPNIVPFNAHRFLQERACLLKYNVVWTSTIPFWNPNHSQPNMLTHSLVPLCMHVLWYDQEHIAIDIYYILYICTLWTDTRSPKNVYHLSISSLLIHPYTSLHYLSKFLLFLTLVLLYRVTTTVTTTTAGERNQWSHRIGNQHHSWWALLTGNQQYRNCNSNCHNNWWKWCIIGSCRSKRWNRRCCRCVKFQ